MGPLQTGIVPVGNPMGDNEALSGKWGMGCPLCVSQKGNAVMWRKPGGCPGGAGCLLWASVLRRTGQWALVSGEL